MRRAGVLWCAALLCGIVALSADSETAVIFVLKTQPDKQLVQGARLLYDPVVDAALHGLRSAAAAEGMVREDVLANYQSQADRAELGARAAVARRIADVCGPEQREFIARLKAAGATSVRSYAAFNAVFARVPAGALPALAADPAVAGVSIDRELPARLDVSRIALGAPAFHDVGMTGAGQSIALIDSGVDVSHPALVGAHIIRGPVFSNDWYSTGIDDPTSPDDFTRLGHGTQMAGILVGQGAPGYVRRLGVVPGAPVEDAHGHGPQHAREGQPR